MDEKVYHYSGQLELSHNRESLTPCFPSRNAQEVLEHSFFNSDCLDQVAELMAGFRYDLILEKCQRLASTDHFYQERTSANGTVREVWLQQFFAVKGRLDGQCIDLAEELLMQCKISHVLDPIEQEAQKRGWSLQYAIGGGYAPTFFVGGDADHYWVEVSIHDGKDDRITLIFDPALQRIGTHQDGYYTAARFADINALERSMTHKMLVGEAEQRGNKYRLFSSSSIVLGITPDKKYAVAVGFNRDRNMPQTQFPFLITIAQDGTEQQHQLSVADGDFERFLISEPNQPLINERTKALLMQMLTVLSTVRFQNIEDVPDEDKQRIELAAKEMHIQLK